MRRVACTVLARQDPPRQPARQIRLESGRVVEYTIPFDRNALQASERAGNSLIALTSSGVLLRFQLPDVRLVHEHAETVEIKCLGRGEGGAILAGLADGRVCRVNPATLEVTEIAKLPAPARWIGWLSATASPPAGLVVVTGSTRSTVHDLVNQKSFTVDHKASTSLLDTTGRLWLGADNGEWGGRVTRVDLTKGTRASIDPPPSGDPDWAAHWDGIYGFIELRDHQVWAYGGMSHMGINSRNITRVDEDKPRPIVERRIHAALEEKPDAPPTALPISHILTETVTPSAHCRLSIRESASSLVAVVCSASLGLTIELQPNLLHLLAGPRPLLRRRRIRCCAFIQFQCLLQGVTLNVPG